MTNLFCECGAQSEHERVTNAYTVFWCPNCHKWLATAHTNENGGTHDQEP